MSPLRKETYNDVYIDAYFNLCFEWYSVLNLMFDSDKWLVSDITSVKIVIYPFFPLWKLIIINNVYIYDKHTI